MFMIEDIDLGNCIHLYRNSFSKELCREIWDFFHENISIARPGQTITGINKAKTTLDILSDTFLYSHKEVEPAFIDLSVKVYESLKDPINQYIQNYDWIANCPNIIDTGYIFQLYEQGVGEYREHIDGCSWVGNSEHRIMGVVVYINDVEQGGETYFRYQNISVKPEAGSVLLFPAFWSHPHQSNIPISGKKLIVSSFVVNGDYDHGHHH